LQYLHIVTQVVKSCCHGYQAVIKLLEVTSRCMCLGPSKVERRGARISTSPQWVCKHRWTAIRDLGYSRAISVIFFA